MAIAAIDNTMPTFVPRLPREPNLPLRVRVAPAGNPNPNLDRLLGAPVAGGNQLPGAPVAGGNLPPVGNLTNPTDDHLETDLRTSPHERALAPVDRDRAVDVDLVPG